LAGEVLARGNLPRQGWALLRRSADSNRNRISPPDSPDDYLYPFLGSLLAVLIVINKGLNDAVHVARAFSGLPKLADKKSDIEKKAIARIRSIVGAIGIHRAYHSVEMTLLFSIAYFVDLLQEAFLLLVIASPLVTLGHIISILASNRLKKSE